MTHRCIKSLHSFFFHLCHTLHLIDFISDLQPRYHLLALRTSRFQNLQEPVQVYPLKLNEDGTAPLVVDGQSLWIGEEGWEIENSSWVSGQSDELFEWRAQSRFSRFFYTRLMMKSMLIRCWFMVSCRKNPGIIHAKIIDQQRRGGDLRSADSQRATSSASVHKR